MDTYYLQNSRGCFVKIPHVAEFRTSAVEVPTVFLTQREYGESSLDDETKEELELAVTVSNRENDVLRQVIGQATGELRHQTTSEVTEGSGYDRGDEWAGNGDGFYMMRHLEVGSKTSLGEAGKGMRSGWRKERKSWECRCVVQGVWERRVMETRSLERRVLER